MSKLDLQLTYDGPALSDHGMDVTDLAPSLLALANIIKKANYRLNGEAAVINVVVQSNFEHKCFKINLEIIQSIIQKLREFFDSDAVSTIKDIAGLVGFLSGAGVGLLKYLAIRNGREIESVTKVESADETGIVSVKFKGDNNTVNITNQVYILGEDADIRKDAARLVAPLKKEGIEKLQLGTEKRPDRLQIDRSEATAIAASHEKLRAITTESFDPQKIIAHLTITRPDFSEGSRVWRFRFGDRTIPVDVSETTIPDEVRQRGYVRIGDTWKVRLQIQERKTGSGVFVTDYKALEVIEYIPGSEQLNLLTLTDEEENANPAQEVGSSN